jgi:hypothetical protein
VAAVVATAAGMRFAWRNLALPQWLVYALGAALLAIGAFTIVKATKALKCGCGKTLDEGSVVLPGDGGREATIVKGVRDGQVASLAGLVRQSDDFSLKLELAFCPSCRQTANLTLVKNGSEKLVQDRLLTGAPASEAIAFMQQYGKVEDDD